MIVPAPHPYPRLLPLLRLADPSTAQIEQYIFLADTFVVQNGAAEVGCLVLLELEEGWGEIKNLAVDPAWQGQGIGTQLLHFAQAEATRRAWQRLRICTGNSSRKQFHLYQKLGFELVAIEADYFLQHYPEPIWEGECWCRDRMVLEKRLK